MLISAPSQSSFTCARQSDDPGLRNYRLTEEPPELRGVLFQQDRDGTVTLLRRSGETDPTGPPDIPRDAAVDGEVFISVDGIGQDWTRHREQIRDLFHGGLPSGSNLQRPVIGIHEGEGKDGISDGLRIVKNTLILKSLQAGILSASKAKRLAYRNDPAVKTIYDQLRQSLEVGRHVTFMAHSGGGAQVALAMSMLALEENGRFEDAIGTKVRVLATAPAASERDFLAAGVASENLYLTGSGKDPVHRFYRRHMDFRRPPSVVSAVADGLVGSARFLLNKGPYHSGEYIFEQNQTHNGSHIAEFLHGGPGEYRPIP